MTVNGRTITLTNDFLAQLAAIQTYVSVQNAEKGRQLTTDLFDFLVDIIAPNPFMFVEYPEKQTPEKMYRRAVFRRTYFVIYKVTVTEITFLVVYHASRNPDSIEVAD